MSTRRLGIVLLTWVATTWTAGNQANACGFTDWLFGRSSSPYAVNYPPAYTSGYASYYAGYAPAAAACGSSYPAPQTTVMSSGAYQVQRPAYYDNPSVYTGRPVLMSPGSVQTTYRLPVTSQVPLSTTLRGASAPAYQGAYPSTYQSAYPSTYQSAYPSPAAAAAPLSMAAPVGTPMTAIPATPVAPVFQVAPPQRSGLARFFGSLLGTNYQTTYYRAPITYYRPATSVDPVTGTTVTVQQPCTSHVQQIQRTPSRTLSPVAQSPSLAYPSNPYPSNVYPPATSYPSATVPAGGSGIGQVGGIASPSDRNVIPIPSNGSSLPPSYYSQPSYVPNTAPLTGAPPAAAEGDLAPIDQPRLESARPAEPPTPEVDDAPNTPNSLWQLQRAEDSTAMHPQSRVTDPAGLIPPANHDLRPIPAPDDYESPFRRRSVDVYPSTPVNQRPLVAPPLPPSDWNDTDATSASTRTGTLYREAALIRKTPAPRRVEKPATESGWYTP